MHESRSLSDFKSSVLTLEISGNFLSHTDTRTQTVTEIRPGRDTHTDNNCVYLLTLWLKCAKKYLPKYVCRFQRVYGYKLQLIMQTEQQKIKHYLWLGPLQQCSQKEKLILKHSGKQKSRKNRHLAASRLRRHNMFEESRAERAPHSRERESAPICWHGNVAQREQQQHTSLLGSRSRSKHERWAGLLRARCFL